MPDGGVGADGVLRPDQGAQRRLLLPGQPAQLGGVAADLGPAPLHQREHLQHAVVHDAGQPGPLGGGRGGALRPRRARRPSAAASRT